MAFRSAELHRAAHAIDVEIISVTDGIPVKVSISRNGLRLGRSADATARGSTFVRVRIGPKGLKPLHAGLHVAVAIDYGSAEPLHTRARLTLPPPGQDTDDEVGLAS